MVMNIHDYFGSDFLKSRAVRSWKDPVCKIVDVGEANFPNDDRSKPCLDLEDRDGNSRGQLVLNKTNTYIIADEYGDDMEKWIGKWVRLSVHKVNFAGDMVDGIRVETPGETQEDTDKHAKDDELNDDIPF